MPDDTNSILLRSPTFSERMRLTWLLFSKGLPLPTVWLTALWSSGATVNISLTSPQSAKLVIENGNKGKTVTVTFGR